MVPASNRPCPVAPLHHHTDKQPLKNQAEAFSARAL
jgi:hypothetical protein